MGLTTYLTVNGRIYSQKKNGDRTHFIHDALGSVAATVNDGGSVVNKYAYKPSGELLSKTGVGEDPKFLWVGGPGYRTTGRRWAEKYVRRRHYGEQQGMWTTVDPLWPEESAYGYVGGNPTNFIDWHGNRPIRPNPDRWPQVDTPRIQGCEPKVEVFIRDFCKRLGSLADSQLRLVARCLFLGAKFGRSNCPDMNRECLLKCMKRWCKEGNVKCIPGDSKYAGYTPYGPSNFDPCDPFDNIILYPDMRGGTFLPRDRPSRKYPHLQLTFIHELGHACGIDHGTSDSNRQCNDIFACCLWDVMYAKGDGSYCYKLLFGQPSKCYIKQLEDSWEKSH